MEIISIEARTFDRMLKRLETAARMAEDVHRRFREKKMGEWLDNQEACILLNITPRTLQSLRENGMLAYSQICHKIYYKPEDIQKTLSLLLKKGRRNSHERTADRGKRTRSVFLSKA